LRLHHLYFPGWQVYQDGKPVETTSDGVAGIVTATLPAGKYRILAKFGNSSIRILATALSILSLVIWFTLSVHRQRKWQNIFMAVFLLVAVNIIVWYFTDSNFGRRTYKPTAFESRFESNMALLGYYLPKNQICVDETTPLRLYWFTGRTPKANFKYFIHVVTLDDSHKVAQFDAMPFNGFSPTTRWEVGELIVDEQPLFFDDSIQPGPYQLLIGLYDPMTMQNEHVLSSPVVLPGDRLKLIEFELIDCAD
jgi:hypothetical protein